MTPMVPPDMIEDIKSRLDIVDVVSEHVELKRAGKNYLGLCPFHSEKTASFTVSQEKQIFHCFGCNKGGDLITFHMDITSASFYETLETLANRCGIELPKYDRARDEKRNLLIDANENAMFIYHRILVESETGTKTRQYLEKRGLGKECIEEFLLGFAPAQWEGLGKACSKKKLPDEVFVKAGLMYEGREGRPPRDLFRNRLIFPIMDVRARPIGFGGRSMDGREPKYLNTPETPVFNKGRNLYGLHISKNEIRARKAAIIVEGYTDLLALYQAGYRNVVAPLGTALTDEQAAILSKMCDTVYLMYDSDYAGRRAAFRGGDILLRSGLIPKLIDLPAGEDPASLIQKEGAGAVKSLIDEAQDIFDAKIRILRKRGNLKSVEGKREALKYLIDSLVGIEDDLMRRLYIEKCSGELNVPIEMLSREIEDRKKKRSRFRKRGEKQEKEEKKIHDLTEKYLLLLLLTDRCENETFRNTVSALEENDFLNEEYCSIFSILKGLVDNEGNVLEYVLSRSSQELHSTVSSIAMDEAIVQNPERMLEDCIRKLKARRIKKSMSEISENLRKIDEKEKQGEADVLARRFYELTQELSSLFLETKE